MKIFVKKNIAQKLSREFSLYGYFNIFEILYQFRFFFLYHYFIYFSIILFLLQSLKYINNIIKLKY